MEVARMRKILLVVSLMGLIMGFAEMSVRTQVGIPFVVQLCKPAVVQIWDVISPEEADSKGSGFIINPNGYILTALHVIAEVKGRLAVLLQDHKVYSAELVAYAEDWDIALLRIQASNLPTLILGDSQRVKEGDPVFVMGYPTSPYGATFATTEGVISRIYESEAGRLFQTSAPVNPGNSGGPLLNERGEVIGMVIEKAMLRAEALRQMIAEEEPIFIPEGIAFAVPANMAKRIIPPTVPYDVPGELLEEGEPLYVGGWRGWASDPYRGVHGGEHYINVPERHYVYWSYVPLEEPVEDFILYVSVRQIQIGATGVAGVIFRLTDLGDDDFGFYMFGVSNDGRFRLDKLDTRLGEDRWIEIIPWTRSPYLHTELSYNHLKVVVKGSKMFFYANGEYLAWAMDLTGSPYKKGWIALAAWARDVPQIKARFRDFALYSVKE